MNQCSITYTEKRASRPSLSCFQIRVVVALVGSRIRIRIKVKRRIRINIRVKMRIRIHCEIKQDPNPHQSLNSGAVAAQHGALKGWKAWTFKTEPCRVYRKTVADSHHFEAQDPESHRSEKSNPDQHQCDADTQHCLPPILLVPPYVSIYGNFMNKNCKKQN
jgi:hypothetical protein